MSCVDSSWSRRASARPSRAAGRRIRRPTIDFADSTFLRFMSTACLRRKPARLLLIAMALDVDARVERLYGYLQDDVSRRRASVGLGLELCGLPSSSAYARSRLAPGAPQVNEYLVQVEENDRPVLTRPLRVPDRVAAHLLGSDIPDAVVAALASQCEQAAPEQAATLVRWMRAESPSPF